MRRGASTMMMGVLIGLWLLGGPALANPPAASTHKKKAASHAAPIVTQEGRLPGPERTGVKTEGRITSYPKKQAAESKGTGKAVRFDEGRAAGPEKTGAKVDSRTTSYPRKQPPEAKGTAVVTDFAAHAAPLPYPKTYHNPADDVPMQKRVAQESTKESPAPPLPPADLCPLQTARPLYLEYNRYWRLTHIRGVMDPDPMATVWTRSRALKTPVRARGEIKLVRTFYDEAGSRWGALVSIPKGYTCEPGDYAVYTDDGLGAQTAVLAIGAGYVLIRVGERLAYWPAQNGDAIAWRLVWDSGVEVRYRQTAKESNVKSSRGKERPTWNAKAKDGAAEGKGEQDNSNPEPVQEAAPEPAPAPVAAPADPLLPPPPAPSPLP